jgi:phosphatidylglycerol:prolipoprotein diacylglycerol transferase
MALQFPDMDPVLIHLGPFAIRWYALAYITGLLVGWWLVLRMIHQKSLWKNPPFNGKPPATDDDIGDLVVWATLGVILGGRIGWVLLYGIFLCGVTPDAGAGYCHGLPMGFVTDPIRIIAVWEGGMSFHGAAIGVLLAIWMFCRKRKLSFFSIGDLVCAVEPIGQGLGRLANFVNGELWGRPTTEPWGMVFCSPHIMQTNHGFCPAGNIPRHPSQIYEFALEGVLMLIIMQVGIRYFRWQDRPGLTSGIFLICYGALRIVSELFREPDAPFLGPITMGEMLSFFFILGGAFVVWLAYRQQPKRAAA